MFVLPYLIKLINNSFVSLGEQKRLLSVTYLFSFSIFSSLKASLMVSVSAGSVPSVCPFSM